MWKNRVSGGDKQEQIRQKVAAALEMHRIDVGVELLPSEEGQQAFYKIALRGRKLNSDELKQAFAITGQVSLEVKLTENPERFIAMMSEERYHQLFGGRDTNDKEKTEKLQRINGFSKSKVVTTEIRKSGRDTGDNEDVVYIYGVSQEAWSDLRNSHGSGKIKEVKFIDPKNLDERKDFRSEEQYFTIATVPAALLDIKPARTLAIR